MSRPILIVDDEENIVELVKHYLTREGFSVVTAGDGPEALRKFQETTPSLVVLDLMLPGGMSGMDVCREIRRGSAIPIIMLTARDDIVDKVVGFELGADDYLTKPFEPKELVARVRALMRRMGTEQTVQQQTLTFTNLRIDPDRREVRVRDQLIDLRPKEFDLLLALARSPGQVFSREQLLNIVWGYDFEGFSRTVDVHVQHLRDKIAASGGTPYIHTVWGVGYKFQERADSGEQERGHSE